MKKANRVFCSLRRNVAFKVNMRIKLGLYKSMILPVLMYGSSCCNLNRGDMRNLERFQRKVVSWITNSKTLSYIEQLRLSNLLPLPMYYQLNDFFTTIKYSTKSIDKYKTAGAAWKQINEKRRLLWPNEKTTWEISRRILLSHPKDSQQTSSQHRLRKSTRPKTQNSKANDVMMRYKPETSARCRSVVTVNTAETPSVKKIPSNNNNNNIRTNRKTQYEPCGA